MALVSAGTDVTVIRFLGDARVDTTSHYARANLDTKRKALEQVDTIVLTLKYPIAACIRGPPVDGVTIGLLQASSTSTYDPAGPLMSSHPVPTLGTAWTHGTSPPHHFAGAGAPSHQEAR